MQFSWTAGLPPVAPRTPYKGLSNNSSQCCRRAITVEGQAARLRVL
jgi:hypothetical protein